MEYSKFEMLFESRYAFDENSYSYGDNFNISRMTSDVVLNMLSDIENKLLCFSSDKYYLIIRRVSDNMILKTEIEVEIDGYDFVPGNTYEVEEYL